jgi:hypothetical protein
MVGVVAGLAWRMDAYYRTLGKDDARSSQIVKEERGGKSVERSGATGRWFIYCTFMVLNLIAVGGVNVVFVLTALYRSNRELVLAQIVLSFFKLMWNTAVTPYMIRFLATRVSNDSFTTGFMTIQVMVGLFNNIAIPCLVVAAVSPSCFYNFFDNAPVVTSEFIYETCVAYSTSNDCIEYAPRIGETTFNPSFRYDYQCSSSFITYYAPAFVYLAITASFAVPVLKLGILQLHKRASPGSSVYRVLDACLSRLLKPMMVMRSDGTIVIMPRDSIRISTGNANRHAEESAAITPDGSHCTLQSLDDLHSSLHRRVVRDSVLQRNPLHPLFDANKFLTALITYLGILLTFGVVFPPLAVAMLVTMLSVAWQGRLEVGRFLCMANEIDATMFAEVIEQECKGAVTTLQLRQSIFFVICFACCFYALFLFDTLGDAVS